MSKPYRILSTTCLIISIIACLIIVYGFTLLFKAYHIAGCEGMRYAVLSAFSGLIAIVIQLIGSTIGFIALQKIKYQNNKYRVLVLFLATAAILTFGGFLLFRYLLG
ncbi:MAG: hypothetical protein H8E62_05995 [Planctomycetes bacterium]|nr:hypothetical protein [Planctomycetota bacterium]